MSDTTHDEQNARIARLLGWRVEQVQEPGYTDFVEVWSPDGAKRGLSDNGRWSERIHETYLDRVLPDFRGDLNALWSALRGLSNDNHRYALYVYDAGFGDNTAVIRDMIALDIPQLTWNGHDDDNVAQAAANALEALLAARAKEAE